MQQAAYDLKTFENRPSRPPLQLSRKNKKTPQRSFYRLKLILAAVVVVSLAWGVLYSQAQITELTSQISTAEKELTDAKSEYDYLNLTLESLTDLKTVEEYAVTQLGLSRMNAAQVTYLAMEDEDRVEKPESGLESFFENFTSGFMNVMEYLAP